MPQVKNFDQVFVFAKLVIDQNRAVRQLPHSGSLSYGAAHSRKSRQEFHVVEQGIAEALRGLWIIFGDVLDDAGEIV